MHVLSRRFSLPVLAALVVLFPAAASAATISGRVVDPDGRPVARARVLVAADEPALVRSVITEDDGRFTAEAADGRRVTLRVTVEGFRAATVVVDRVTSVHDVGTITLAISAIAESVVVSASQVEVPLTEVTASVSVITGEELEARQLRSVADALRTVPGLTVVSTGGVGTTTGLFPRGGESNYTLVLVDGAPVNAFGGDFDFAHLSTDNVERIEIVRGPQSALFGSNAIGSVVRIVTRRGGRPTAQADVETGQKGTTHVSLSTAGQRGAFEWGASFGQLDSDGMNGEQSPAGDTIVNDEYRRRTAALSAGWNAGGATIRGDVRHARDERGLPGPFGSNPIGAYTGIDAISSGDNARTIASLSATAPLSKRVRVQGQAGFSRIDSDFLSPFGESDAFSRRWAARGQADFTIAQGLDVSAGVERQDERAGSTFITGAAAQAIPVERATTGYFAEGRLQAQNRVFVTAGLRVEDIRRNRIEESPDAFSPRPILPPDTVVSVNPRIAGAWLVSSGADTYTKLRAAIGTGIRPPDGFELAFTDNPNLRPERSVSAEAGVDQAFARGHGLVEATAFFNRYDDLIVAVGSFSASSRFRTDNISNARARGLELALTLRGRVPARRAIDITGRAGYTLLDTEILAVDEHSSAPPPFSVGQALLRRPTHQFFADVSIRTGALTAFMRGNGRGTVLDVEPSFGTFGGLFDAAGYQVWTAGVSWQALRFVDFFGRVENLFDRSYEEAFGFPLPGRRATLGFRIAAGR